MRWQALAPKETYFLLFDKLIQAPIEFYRNAAQFSLPSRELCVNHVTIETEIQLVMTYWWHEQSLLVCVESSRSGRVTLYAATRTLHEATPTCTIYNCKSNGQVRRIMQQQSDKAHVFPSFRRQSVKDPDRISENTPKNLHHVRLTVKNTVIMLRRLVHSRKHYATCTFCIMYAHY